MSNLVIVAVPDENDRVWKVSSEKVPHLTMLFLGETAKVSNLESIMQFVEHAASTTLQRFYLPVDRRGELGEDKADVLFFKKGRYDYKAIRDFRATLLQNENIKTAYDSAEQFEGPWLPHLTLGYPETPANKVPDDQISSFYDVSFNKIAVWVGDFEGPDFLLKDYWDEYDTLETVPMDVAMSDIRQRKDEVLTHFGVKGMRWGVRNDRHGRNRFDPKDHSVEGDALRALLLPPGANIPSVVRLGKRASRGTKAYMEKRNHPDEVAKRDKRKLARKDFYWEMHAYSDISHADVHNKVADEIDSKVHLLQTAPKYRGKNLKTDKKLADEYDQDVAKVTDSAYRRAVKDTYGVNPSGTKEARYVNDVRGARVEIRDKATGKTLSEKDLHPVQEDIKDEVGHAAFSHTSLLHADKFEEPLLVITMKTNPEGFITEIGRVKLPEDEETSMAQTADLGAEFLAHVGIKGMRWGVRKDRPAPVAVAPTATSRVPHGSRRKTKIEVDGGENHPAHEDAIKVARAQAKLKKSGTAALSNQELQELQNRLNLERNVTQLVGSTTRIGKGRQFVKGVTGLNRDLNDTVGTGLQTKRLAGQLR